MADDDKTSAPKRRGRPKGQKSKPGSKRPGPKTTKLKDKKELKKELNPPRKVIKLKTADELNEDQAIEELFKNSRLRRFQALFREMENGKGISAIQAANEIAKIEEQIKEEDADQKIEIIWNVIPTDKAEEIA